MTRALAPLVVSLAVAAALVGGCAAVLGLDAGSAADDAGGGIDASTPNDGDGKPDGLGAQGDGAIGLPTCGADQHLCGAACAPKSDPQFGCGASSCAPCKLAHATAACGAGACAVATCNMGWADCNKVAGDGCEADLSAPATCGSCTTPCTTPPLCDTTGCVTTCPSPKTICNGSCANTTNDPNHCGLACTACAPAHAPPACTASVCDRGACDVGYADCNLDRADGCETSLASDTSCGSCTTNCRTPSAGHTVGLCGAGPACVPTACESGWEDCDGNLANGCTCFGAACCGGGDAGTPPPDGGCSTVGCIPPTGACMVGQSTCCCPATCNPPSAVVDPWSAPAPTPSVGGFCCVPSGVSLAPGGCPSPDPCCAPSKCFQGGSAPRCM